MVRCSAFGCSVRSERKPPFMGHCGFFLERAFTMAASACTSASCTYCKSEITFSPEEMWNSRKCDTCPFICPIRSCKTTFQYWEVESHYNMCSDGRYFHQLNTPLVQHSKNNTISVECGLISAMNSDTFICVHKVLLDGYSEAVLCIMIAKHVDKVWKFLWCTNAELYNTSQLYEIKAVVPDETKRWSYKSNIINMSTVDGHIKEGSCLLLPESAMKNERIKKNCVKLKTIFYPMGARID